MGAWELHTVKICLQNIVNKVLCKKYVNYFPSLCLKNYNLEKLSTGVESGLKW